MKDYIKVTLEKIYKALSRCAIELDKCADLIRDSQLEPVREHIHRIGSALENINEIRMEIIKLEPLLLLIITEFTET